jgi:hypothetical protein
MTRLATLGSVLLLTFLLAGAAVAKSPHQANPDDMVPPLNPNFAPWTCVVNGGGIICQGYLEVSWANEDIGLSCDGQPIYSTGTEKANFRRWHTPDGRATKTAIVAGVREKWSLSPDGSGPTLNVHWNVMAHYTYFTPGELSDRQKTETGAWWIATAPGSGLVFRDAGKIVYAVGAQNDGENPVEMRGQFDTWTDFDAALGRACAALGA